MRRVRQAATFAAVLAAMGAFLTEGAAVYLLVGDPVRRRRLRVARAQAYARFATALLDVRVRVDGELGPSYRRRLFVCNHLSYLDVLVLMSATPACFVTSEDIRCTPFLGWICAAAGCLFVERRRKASVRADLRKIERALRNGCDIAVFPEATSTAGEKVLPFKPAVFRSAADAAAFVQPLHLRYESIGGRPVDARARDLVCWYGDMTFVPHLWKLSGCRAIKARLSVLDALPGAGAEPRALAERAHALVRRRHAGSAEPAAVL